MTWLVPLLAFFGGLVGAGLAAWVAVRGQHQDARGEWRQRLDRAIDMLTSTDDVRQQIGDELLADLIESDLGSDADRELARRLGHIRVGAQVHHVRVGLPEMDVAAPVRDNDDVDGEREEPT